MSAVAAAIGGGALLSAGSGILGAQSSNRAGRQARDWTNSRSSEGMDRLLGMLFGMKGVNSRNGLRPAGPIDTSGARLAQSMGGGFAGQLQGLLGNSQSAGAANLGVFNRDAGGLMRMSEGMTDTARGYGRGMEAMIDQETQLGLTGANRASTAALNARGFGTSSVVGNQLSNNARDFTRQGTAAKLGVRNQTTDRVLESMNRGLGLQAGINTQRTGLREGNTARNLGIKQGNIATLLQALTGNTMNPWLNQGSSQYYPGLSGAGSAAGGAGNALAQYGSMQMMLNQFGQPQQRNTGAPRQAGGVGNNR